MANDAYKGVGMKEVIMVILIVVSIFATIAFCGIVVNKLACDEFSSINSDYEFRFDIMTGCKMKTPNGFWISTSLIRYTDGKLILEAE